MNPQRKKTSLAELWDEASKPLEFIVKDYHLNQAYLRGTQWWDYDEITSEVAPPLVEEDADRIQATMNHTRANTRTIMSQLTQRELSFWVTPNAYDDANKRAARLGRAILDHRRYAYDWETLREDHLQATWAGGTGVIMVEWSDKNKEPKETVLSIANVRVEPGAPRWEFARWVIKQQLLPPRQVQALYPDVYAEAPPKPDAKTGFQISSAYRLDDREQRMDLTRVLTYYERPNPLNPKGFVAVEIGNKIIEHGDWPFPWNHRLNIAVARESIEAEVGHGTTILSDMQSPQTALNGAWSAFLEALRDASTNILVMDETWRDNIDEITDRPGDVLTGRTRDGIKLPYWMQAPAVPQTVVEGIHMLKDTLDDLSGVHDVSRGQAPANIESGYGLSILAEKDNSPVGRLIKESARAWSWVAEMELRLLADKITEPQKITTWRKEWKGSDLREQFDVHVPLDAIVPRSQAAMQQFAQTAMQMGLIEPGPMAAVKVVQLSEMPDQRGMIAALNPHADKAIRENTELADGQVPMPAPWDDHAVHMEILTKFMVSEEFGLLTRKEQENCVNHLQAHSTMLAESVADRQKGAEVNPALGTIPRADGAPPVEPLPEGLPPQEAPPPEAPLEEPAVDAGPATDQMIQAMEEGL